MCKRQASTNLDAVQLALVDCLRTSRLHWYAIKHALLPRQLPAADKIELVRGRHFRDGIRAGIRCLLNRRRLESVPLAAPSHVRL